MNTEINKNSYFQKKKIVTTIDKTRINKFN